MDHNAHSFFTQTGFMPHGHCYLWKPALLWTHFFSDLLIGLAYILIAFLLYTLVRKIRLPFSPVFLAFGTFIAACGVTHFMGIWTLWNPDYWVSGGVKVVTALASVATGIALIPLRPKVIALSNSAKLSEERKAKLESAHAELEVLYQKVTANDELKTQFFANVSHELRTPLALILGPIEALKESSNLSKEEIKKLDVAHRNAKVLLKQVNELLDMSKLEAGKMAPSYAKADLVKLIRFVESHFENVFVSRKINYSLTAPDQLMVEVDPEKIQRIYMNLLSNAVKFTPDGGVIKASITENGDQASIIIEDSGPGISDELKSVIFERFRQGDSGANRKLGGTGLGLALAKDFAELHLGSLKLLNPSHFGGARFEVTLPKHAPKFAKVLEVSDFGHEISQTMVEGSALEMVSEAPEKFSSSGHLIETKILVCEDNADMNRFISQILSPSAHIFSAMNGQEALSMAKTISPDLIVSDVMMPSMIGDQLVAELQKNPTLKQIPILLLSARADEEMRIRLLKEGASDYLVKPFSPEELKVRANNLLQMKLARDLLQKELSSKSQNVVDLVQEMSERKRETELAFEVTKAARAEAEKSSQVKSAFLSLVSHELNTPLMTLSLGVQILQNALKNQIDTKQQEVLSRLSRSVKQLKALIEGLLEYVRSGHPEKLKTEEVNISRLLKDLKDEFQITADSKGLQLSLDLSDSDLMIESDLTKLKVILSNLVVNAIKFTQKGEVKISAQESGRLIEIRVKDSGPGISQQDQQRIFEPFEQIEPLERKTIPGIGLGLSLVKQLADVLHAEITLVSEVGQGSEFGVKLHKRASAHPMNKD